MSRLDWPSMMRAGLCRLRLRPDEFWRLTPAELVLMLGLDQTDAPLGRAGLDALLKAFPDTERTTQDGSD